MAISLKEQVNQLPTKPGCYLFYNDKNQILYVGKAKNLKNRVSSYFNKVYNYKTTKLVQEITRLETIITGTEKEALILEHNLIKQHKPKYNILLNDDKHYPYIIITKEKDPQYLYLRKIPKKYSYAFGPFPDGSHAREIMKVLERLYPLRRCQGNLGKPCLYYHIKQCSGACFQDVPAQYYLDMIKRVRHFFSGKNDDTKDLLTLKMHQAAQNLQFEEANKLKLLIRRLDWSISDQNVEFLAKKDNLDVIGIYYQDDYLVITTLFYRQGKLSYKDSEFLVCQQEQFQETVRLYLQELYDKTALPPKIFINEMIESTELELLYGAHFFYPKTKTEKIMMNLANSNSQETYQQIIKRQALEQQTPEVLTKLQDLLQLPEIPYLIEMIDIANIQDEYVTGAAITYKNGKPSRNDYRKYHIDIPQQDDGARIANVVARRYQKILTTNGALPNLIIMDGGIQQVNACRKELQALQLTIPVIGLVKNKQHRTDHLLDVNRQEVYLPKDDKLFLFLTKMQDDVHRFAITSFRKRQSRGLISSILDQVPGLGPQKIKQLQANFPTIKDIIAASSEQLNEIIKNKNTVKALQNTLQTIK
ncbi:excinuclease ABC subunit C [Spiroplasma syrphidicola EA-1]|uniref:UvrABC system protein C n=1 Tax=Spiroplasma syrphidicola EA-1 TaxID=1276229 RepID=R4U460_9MOLU|nr:excinuclease ABC subunit UvrC [Spiroplasma syrphidicola]AGM26232.1 excinuclease ABC subunit C [Spiroplasma syrphidicola EA-1]